MLSQKSHPQVSSRLNFLQIVSLFAIITTLACQARSGSDAGSVTLVWDSNTEPNVSGYNVHFGTESGAYNTVLDAGSDPEFQVTDLEFGVTYYCAVTAYNTIGLESSFSAEISITYLGGENGYVDGRLILLEAEGGTINPPMVIQGNSGQSWVQDNTFSESGATNLAFNSQINGVYHVWCRMKAPNAGSDSYFVSLNGGPEQVFHAYSTPSPNPSVYTDNWVWRRINNISGGARDFTLTQGLHSLNFRSREAGVLLDRIVLCSDPDFVPDDNLPRIGDVLAVTSPPTSKSVAAGGNVVLDVIAAATGPIQYQWVKDGLAINGETGPTLQISAAEFNDIGTYSVFIWSNTAIRSAGPAELTVFEPPLRVTGMTIGTDRSVTFNLSGQLGKEVQIYASSNLESWSHISTQINTDGTIDIDDPDAVGKPKRFYKLVSPNP